MYRLLDEVGENRDRRDQLVHIRNVANPNCWPRIRTRYGAGT
jgi:hypothetical protein